MRNQRELTRSKVPDRHQKTKTTEASCAANPAGLKKQIVATSQENPANTFLNPPFTRQDISEDAMRRMVESIDCEESDESIAKERLNAARKKIKEDLLQVKENYPEADEYEILDRLQERHAHPAAIALQRNRIELLEEGKPLPPLSQSPSKATAPCRRKYDQNVAAARIQQTRARIEQEMTQVRQENPTASESEIFQKLIEMDAHPQTIAIQQQKVKRLRVLLQGARAEGRREVAASAPAGRRDWAGGAPGPAGAPATVSLTPASTITSIEGQRWPVRDKTLPDPYTELDEQRARADPMCRLRSGGRARGQHTMRPPAVLRGSLETLPQVKPQVTPQAPIVIPESSPKRAQTFARRRRLFNDFNSTGVSRRGGDGGGLGTCPYRPSERYPETEDRLQTIHEEPYWHEDHRNRLAAVKEAMRGRGWSLGSLSPESGANPADEESFRSPRRRPPAVIDWSMGLGASDDEQNYAEQPVCNRRVLNFADWSMGSMGSPNVTQRSHESSWGQANEQSAAASASLHDSTQPNMNVTYGMNTSGQNECRMNRTMTLSTGCPDKTQTIRDRDIQQVSPTRSPRYNRSPSPCAEMNRTYTTSNPDMNRTYTTSNPEQNEFNRSISLSPLRDVSDRSTSNRLGDTSRTCPQGSPPKNNISPPPVINETTNPGTCQGPEPQNDLEPTESEMEQRQMDCENDMPPPDMDQCQMERSNGMSELGSDRSGLRRPIPLADSTHYSIPLVDLEADSMDWSFGGMTIPRWEGDETAYGPSIAERTRYNEGTPLVDLSHNVSFGGIPIPKTEQCERSMGNRTAADRSHPSSGVAELVDLAEVSRDWSFGGVPVPKPDQCVTNRSGPRSPQGGNAHYSAGSGLIDLSRDSMVEFGGLPRRRPRPQINETGFCGTPAADRTHRSNEMPLVDLAEHSPDWSFGGIPIPRQDRSGTERSKVGSNQGDRTCCSGGAPLVDVNSMDMSFGGLPIPRTNQCRTPKVAKGADNSRHSEGADLVDLAEVSRDLSFGGIPVPRPGQRGAECPTVSSPVTNRSARSPGSSLIDLKQNSLELMFGGEPPVHNVDWLDSCPIGHSESVSPLRDAMPVSFDLSFDSPPNCSRASEISPCELRSMIEEEKKDVRIMHEILSQVREPANQVQFRDMIALVPHIFSNEAETAPEVAAAMLYSDEKGLSLHATPAKVYNMLFRGTDSGKTVIRVNSPAAHNKSGVLVPMGSEGVEAAFAGYPDGPADTSLQDSELPPITRDNQNVGSLKDNLGVSLSSLGKDSQVSVGGEDGRFKIMLEPGMPEENDLIQTRGSQPPSWFPGYYSILGDDTAINVLDKPWNVLEKAWRQFMPERIKTSSGKIIIGS